MITIRISTLALVVIGAVVIVGYCATVGALIYLGAMSDRWWLMMCGTVLAAMPVALWFARETEEDAMTWTRNDFAGNWVLMLGDPEHYVSFQPHGRETALRLGDETLVLAGDFRDEYEAAYKEGGVAACRRVYMKYRDDHPPKEEGT